MKSLSSSRREVLVDCFHVHACHISHLLPGCTVLQHPLRHLNNLRGHHPPAAANTPMFTAKARSLIFYQDVTKCFYGVMLCLLSALRLKTMSSSKPVLFISHITEEKEVALKLKELIDGAFIGLFDTFVSTSPESIQMGNKWLDQISNALHKSAIAIIICSPASVKRPWINFEAGAAWVRDINVIPLCHSGIKPSELPVPLSELQGALASDPSSVRLVLSVLAQALNSKVPNPDVTDFTKFVSEFESTYTLKKTISEIVERIREYDPNIDRKLKNSTPFELAVPLSNDGQFRKDATFLEEKKLAKVQQLVGVSTSSIGMVAIYGIQRLKNLI